MWEVLRSNPLAVLLAVLMHVVIVAFLVVGVDWREKPKPVASTVEVVQARVVDEKKLQTEVNRLKAEQQKKQNQAAAARNREEKRLAELKKRREQEKKQLAALERKRKEAEKTEAKRKEEANKKADQEKKRLAELKKKQEALRKQQEAEKKRLAELERKRKEEAKKRAEAEKKRKAEAEAERKRKEAAARKAAEQKAREQELLAQMQAEQDASEKALVIAQIQAKVQRSWLRPPGTAEQGLRCTVRVRLGSGGSVLLANVVKSSGNGAFDRSVVAAVRKAEPLPMPKSPRLLAQFRDIDFVFDPTK